MAQSSIKKEISGWCMKGKGNTSSENDFHSWVFQSSMLFNARNKWWGDLGKRDFPHEGLDFCLFKDASGNVLQVDEKTDIPVVCDGRVRAIFNDYLGEAIVVEHQFSEEVHPVFLSIYAHTTPNMDLVVGNCITKNEIIATIAEVKNRKSGILPHLHLSFGWPTKAMFYEKFEWNRLREPDLIKLVDPLMLLNLSFETTTRG